jgi:nucleoid-associated protein YgaU
VIVITPPALVQAGEERGRAGPEVATLPSPARPDPGAAAALKTYTIQKGDNLSTLAAKEYGDGKLWAKLAKFNGITDEDGVVRLGQSIKLPPRDVLLGKPAAPAPGGTPRPLARPGAASPRTALAAKEGPKNKTLATNEPALTVTVKKGETLGEIAKRTLGSAKRWPELAEFNKIEDEDHIAAGTVLKVPPMRG